MTVTRIIPFDVYPDYRHELECPHRAPEHCKSPNDTRRSLLSSLMSIRLDLGVRNCEILVAGSVSAAEVYHVGGGIMRSALCAGFRNDDLMSNDRGPAALLVSATMKGMPLGGESAREIW